MPPDIKIEPVGASRGELLRFWKAGLSPYKGDPHFVVPLLHDCMTRWDRGGAFFRHARAQHWIAVRGGKDVGRIAAAVDDIQDQVHGDHTGLFGWYECEDKTETAHALFAAAATWLRENGRDRARGPLSYTTNGVSGLLVDDQRPGPPVVDMAYNPRWYEGQMESFGFAKAKDLVALWCELPETPDPRIERITQRVFERGRFHVRAVRTDRRGFDLDVEHVLTIYNAAWEKNWGFVPLTADEIREQAKAFRPILVPDLMLFAERDGVPVAFSLTLPDINVALAEIKGRLWPWAIAKFLWRQRSIKTVRTITLGVLPEFRKTGLDAALIRESIARAMRRGVRSGECSWMLEDNTAMIRAIEQIGGRTYRRYRVYEKAL